MLKKFLKEVVSIVVGKQAEDIIDLLDNQNYMNEFLIAKKLGITINQTRNILYKISDFGLISSIRKKDKRKGWFTYFWKIEVMKSLEFLRNELMKKIEQINYQIKSRETKRFYVCEQCGIELSEENALLHDFMCSECGNIFTLKDNVKLVKELRKNWNMLKEKLQFVEAEIKKEKDRVDKERAKEIRKEEKKMQKKFKKKRLERKAVKEKLLKKLKKIKPAKKKNQRKQHRKSARKTKSKKMFRRTKHKKKR